ncbi:alpha/beta fold hydrolase [Microdochium nivale]|nr:alpha/beta fold hydrolase [Microdochium nivale]
MGNAIPKPVVLLVHGAWHSLGHYNHLIKSLQATDHTVVAPQLASAGIGELVIGKDLADDVARIDDVADSHIEEELGIILVAHTYGGLPGTNYLEGRTAHKRQVDLSPPCT